MKIGRMVGGAMGLLHVVGDDDDGVVLFKFQYECFDGLSVLYDQI